MSRLLSLRPLSDLDSWFCRRSGFCLLFVSLGNLSDFGLIIISRPISVLGSIFLSRWAMWAIGDCKFPNTASILPIYVPSAEFTIIEPKAGDEPENGAIKPPS